MSRREVSNNEDILDSRDIIKRLEELQDERSSLVDDLETATQEHADADKEEDRAVAYEMKDNAVLALAEWDEENGEELKALTALNDEGEGCADWSHGEALIRETYFTEYAQQLAEDIGAISKDTSWPNTYIDWEAAADALKVDYTSVDFAGETYLVRS